MVKKTCRKQNISVNTKSNEDDVFKKYKIKKCAVKIKKLNIVTSPNKRETISSSSENNLRNPSIKESTKVHNTSKSKSNIYNVKVRIKRNEMNKLLNTINKENTQKQLKDDTHHISRNEEKTMDTLGATKKNSHEIPLSKNIEKCINNKINQNSREVLLPQNIERGINNENDIKKVDNPQDNDVYAFLSQSSDSDRQNSALDIVKKLVKEGKATIVKPKRKPIKREKKKRNIIDRAIQKSKNVTKKNPSVRNIELGETETEFYQPRSTPVMQKNPLVGNGVLSKTEIESNLPRNSPINRNVTIRRKNASVMNTGLNITQTEFNLPRNSPIIRNVTIRRNNPIVGNVELDQTETVPNLPKDNLISGNVIRRKNPLAENIKLSSTTKSEFCISRRNPLSTNINIRRKNLSDRKADMNESVTELPRPNNSTIINRNFENLKSIESNSMNATSNGVSTQNFSQAKRTINKQSLFKTVKNIIAQSTPLRSNKISQPKSNLSPIYISSPWRSNGLPQLFNFTLSKDNLPSYSSDVLPSSQTQNGNNTSLNSSKRLPQHAEDNLQSYSNDVISLSHAQNRNSSSLNSSNIENVAPHRSPVSSHAAIPNLRRGLKQRTPLKSINISDMIDSSNNSTIFENVSKPKSRELSLSKLALFNRQNIKGNHNQSDDTHVNFDVNNISVENCFGFDDISEEEPVNTPGTAIPNKKELEKKLKRLKQLLPPKPTRVHFKKIASIYKEPEKQKDIREMLSSTKLENTNKQRGFKDSLVSNIEKSINLTLESEADSTTNFHLFDDPSEPKGNSDSSIGVRTYSRVPRRRRKVINNLLFSDDSDEEEEIEEEKQSRKKKRTKPAIDKNTKKELNQFCEEFNSMCKDVEDFELHIE